MAKGAPASELLWSAPTAQVGPGLKLGRGGDSSRRRGEGGGQRPPDPVLLPVYELRTAPQRSQSAPGALMRYNHSNALGTD